MNKKNLLRILFTGLVISLYLVPNFSYAVQVELDKDNYKKTDNRNPVGKDVLGRAWILTSVIGALVWWKGRVIHIPIIDTLDVNRWDIRSGTLIIYQTGIRNGIFPTFGKRGDKCITFGDQRVNYIENRHGE